MRRILLGLVGLLLAGPVAGQTVDTVTTSVTDSTQRLVPIWDRTTTVTRTITVKPVTPLTLTKLVLSPDPWAMRVNETQFFLLAPTWSDGLTHPLTPTWKATGGTVTAGTGGALYMAGKLAGSFKLIATASGKADTAIITLSAPVTPPVPPDTTTPPVIPPPSVGTYPNRPASYTASSDLDFSQAVPGAPDNVDRPILGAPSGWNMIFFGTSWTSANGQWTGSWVPGSYGGGVIGQGGGHGIGNIFYYPGNTSRLYMSIRAYFDMTASQWHPISNKFVNIECNNSLILVQLQEANRHWRHVEELGKTGGSWYIDPDPTQAANEPHIAGQIANPPVPVRQWTQIEVLVDLPAKTLKVWQDGLLTTDGKNLPFKSTTCYTPAWNAFRGGGGETITTPFNWQYTDAFIAW